MTDRFDDVTNNNTYLLIKTAGLPIANLRTIKKGFCYFFG